MPTGQAWGTYFPLEDSGCPPQRKGYGFWRGGSDLGPPSTALLTLGLLGWGSLRGEGVLGTGHRRSMSEGD